MASVASPQSGLKRSTFYGSNIARPLVVLDNKGKAVKGRVDPPTVNSALLDWASKVPFQAGGALTKPTWDGPQVQEARNDFQIFFQERYDDILAANPALISAGDRKAMLSAASVFWREELTPQERKTYRDRAVEEKVTTAAALAQAEEDNPRFKAFREQLQKYKSAVGGILSAARVSTGPLWRLQRRLNANAREEAAREAEKAEQEEEEAAGPSKGRRKGKRGLVAAVKKVAAAAKQKRKGKGKAAVQEEEAGEAETAAVAEAMQGLRQTTGKKIAKPSKAGGSAAKKTPRSGSKGPASSDKKAPRRASGSAPKQSEVAAGAWAEAAAALEERRPAAKQPAPAQQQPAGTSGRRRSAAAELSRRLAPESQDVYAFPASAPSSPAGKAPHPAAGGAAAAKPAAARGGSKLAPSSKAAPAAAPAAKKVAKAGPKGAPARTAGGKRVAGAKKHGVKAAPLKTRTTRSSTAK